MNNTNINKINELLSSFSEQQRVRARLEMELKDISVDKEKIESVTQSLSTKIKDLDSALQIQRKKLAQLNEEQKLNTDTIRAYQAEKRELFQRTRQEEQEIATLTEQILYEKLRYAKSLNALSVAYYTNSKENNNGGIDDSTADTNADTDMTVQ